MRGSPISLVGVPNTITGNKTFTGVTTINNQLIVTGEPGAFVTLKLSAASGQTGNLLELYNTSATRVAYFDQAGNFTSTGAVSYASTQVVQGTTGIGFSVKGNASNSSDLQQWQNSSGAVLLGITEAGNLYGGSGLTVGGNLVLTGANGLQIRGDNSTADPGVPWIHSDGSNLTLNPHGSSSVVLCGDIGIQVKFGATGGIIFRIDNSSVDPGLPWMRSDGSSLYISPHGTGTLNLAEDNKQATKVGGTFQVQGGVALNYGSVTAPVTSSISLYVNTASAGATEGRIVLSSNGPTGTDGAFLEYVPPSAGNTVNRLNITGSGGGNLAELDFNATITKTNGNSNISGTLNVAGSSTIQQTLFGSYLQIRADGSTIDPGYAWMRGAGGTLVINPSGGGQLYLCWDKTNQLNVGGVLVVNGASTFQSSLQANTTLTVVGATSLQSTLAVTGQATFSGAVLAHGSYQVVETGNANPLHSEVYGTQGSVGGIGGRNSTSITLNFARPYGAAPGVSGSCNTSAGNADAYVGRSNVSGSAATLSFLNDDSNTQTLSGFSIIAIG